ncbi:acyl-CoA synthetase [Rhodococcus rhodochrous]|uniref:Acyl-CoA synthetase n=1 Tax=Rhodococcus rhodochrous TaxID=1829 RepID=A0AAW4XKD1_RHORH|nr:acyl-CoA synthetase [Rhodococcus rhodochrous]MCD2114113.1 acyl-CoA synthetase [Rhodococcus rhodochrous]
MADITPDTAAVVRIARSHTVGDVLRRTALRVPDKAAIISADRSFTYAEFDEAVNRTANALAVRGIVAGDRVAILSHNSWEVCVLTYALARLGALMVPINYMLNSDEVAYILNHSQARGLVVEDTLFDVAASAVDAAGVELVVRGWVPIAATPTPAGWEAVAEWVDSGDPGEPPVRVDDDDPIRLMYTSGTESRPKGALLSSRSLISQYISCIVDGEMSSDDVEIHALPLYHCAQLDCFLGPDIYVGATSIIVSRPDPELLLRTIQEHKATKLFCPPTVWISLMRSPSFDSTDLSSLRKGYYGASPMPVEVLQELQRRLPDVRLWNFYGQTEMAPLATILKPHEQMARAGSAGRPALNVETRLIDDAGNDVGVGEVGEIVHRSPQATLGYFRDDAKTVEAFRDGWFHSGDLGVFDEDGYLTVVDRKKDMIKTGGENVASREVEEAIYTLSGVEEVAVFSTPDPKWIEAVTAVIVMREGADLDEEKVMAHCRTVLAGYKVPKHVFFQTALPKNPSGKILKRDLRVTYSGAGVAVAAGVEL